MRALLGEITLAKYAPRELDGKWQVESPQAGCNHILRQNFYAHQTAAENAIKHLVPAECREFIRFCLA